MWHCENNTWSEEFASCSIAEEVDSGMTALEDGEDDGLSVIVEPELGEEGDTLIDSQIFGIAKIPPEEEETEERIGNEAAVEEDEFKDNDDETTTFILRLRP